jgi:hypothetical protein
MRSAPQVTRETGRHHEPPSMPAKWSSQSLSTSPSQGTAPQAGCKRARLRGVLPDGVVRNRCPGTTVFWIASKLLESECALGALEDVDAPVYGTAWRGSPRLTKMGLAPRHLRILGPASCPPPGEPGDMNLDGTSISERTRRPVRVCLDDSASPVAAFSPWGWIVGCERGGPWGENT